MIEFLVSQANKLMLVAFATSTALRGIDYFVERVGERHPASKFWPWLDRKLDTADLYFGWFGDFMQRVVFTRRGK